MPDMTTGGVQGTVDPAWAVLRDAFAAEVAASPGTGQALAVWHDGRWCADLWGGFADAARTRPWMRDTLVMPYSVTKAFAAVAVLVLVDRGRLGLDDRVDRWWPGFPSDATVRQVLSHSAGHVLLDGPAEVGDLLDPSRMRALLERQPPAFPPGSGVGEAALVYGHLLDPVVRAADGRSLGTVLREEVTGPLGLDFSIGVSGRDLPRVADLTGVAEARATLEQRAGLIGPALATPPGALDAAVVNSAPWRRAEVGALGGHGTARAVAGLYVALSRGDLLSPGLLAEMTSVQASGDDVVTGGPAAWGLGVGVDPDGVGMGGVGGSFGWWSRAGGYVVAWLTGHLGDGSAGDRLEGVVREALGLPPVG